MTRIQPITKRQTKVTNCLTPSSHVYTRSDHVYTSGRGQSTNGDGTGVQPQPSATAQISFKQCNTFSEG